MTESKSVALPLGYSPLMVEGGRFELPNPKERIYSPPRLATSLPLQIKLSFLLNEQLNTCRLKELNPRPSDYDSDALPTELSRQNLIKKEYDPYGNRTRDTAVKGRCLNRLTNGP